MLSGHPGVRQCAVVALDSGDGEKQLVAYVVQSGQVATDELQSFAREALPVHMVPARFVPLDALPLTASGKIDRRALPDPGVVDRRGIRRAPDAARGSVGRHLAGAARRRAGGRLRRLLCARRALAAGDPGRDPDPQHDRERAAAQPLQRTDRGCPRRGDRRSGARGRERRPPRRDASLRDGARRRARRRASGRLLERGARRRHADPAARPRRAPRRSRSRRSGCGCSSRCCRASAPTTCRGSCAYAGRLDAARAAARARRRRVATRRRCERRSRSSTARPVQQVHDDRTDRARRPRPPRQAIAPHEADELVSELAWQPFDLERDAMVRAALLQLDDHDRLLLVSHHLVSDHGSAHDPPRPSSPRRTTAALAGPGARATGASDPVRRLRGLAAQAHLAARLSTSSSHYWRERLAGAPERFDLPFDRPRPPAKTYAGAELRGFAPGRARRRAARARARAQRLVLHRPPRRLLHAPPPLHGRGGHRRRHADQRPPPRGDAAADRLLLEHARAPSRGRRRADVRGAARARPRDDARRVRAPGAAVRAARGGAEPAARPEPHARLPGAAHPRRRRRAVELGGMPLEQIPLPEWPWSRFDLALGTHERARRRPRRRRRVLDRPLRDGDDRAADRASRRPCSRAHRRRAASVRSGSSRSSPRRERRIAARGMERHRAPGPTALPARARRRAGGPRPERIAVDGLGRDADLRRARRARRTASPIICARSASARATSSASASSGAGDDGRDPRRAEDRRRLRPGRADVPAERKAFMLDDAQAPRARHAGEPARARSPLTARAVVCIDRDWAEIATRPTRAATGARSTRTRSPT